MGHSRKLFTRRRETVDLSVSLQRRERSSVAEGGESMGVAIEQPAESAWLSPGDDSLVKRLVVDFQPPPATEVAFRESQVKRIERG